MTVLAFRDNVEDFSSKYIRFCMCFVCWHNKQLLRLSKL